MKKKKIALPAYDRNYNAKAKKAKAKRTNPWLPVIIAVAIVLASVLAVVLIPRPMDVSGKTFTFTGFEADWAEGTTLEEKQQVVAESIGWYKWADDNLTVENFFDIFTSYYVNEIITDESREYLTFNEDGTVKYIDAQYTWSQSWDTITLTSTSGRPTRYLKIVDGTLVDEVYFSEICSDTKYVWQE